MQQALHLHVGILPAVERLAGEEPLKIYPKWRMPLNSHCCF